MTNLKLFLLIGVLVSVVRPLLTENQQFLGDPRTDDYPQDFIPFKTFLKQVKHAEYEDYEKTNVRDREAFLEIKEHILKMYSGIKRPAEVTSFVLDGEYGDCIPFKEQPTVHLLGIKEFPELPRSSTHNQTADTPTPGNFSYTNSPLKLGLTDQFGNKISCPKQKIPMARMTLEKLTTFSTLHDFFSKAPGVPPNAGADFSTKETHLHAIGRQVVDNFGGNSWLNLWNPVAEFSISQQWFANWDAGFAQTVEAGWIMDTYDGRKKDKSQLFIFRTSDGYKNSVCWDLECPGFVHGNNDWMFGATFSEYSTTDGEQWGFELQWKLYNGNWILFLRGDGDWETLGYYHPSVWNDGPMSKHATYADFGGEVANYASGGRIRQMGSGELAETSYAHAAYQSTIFYIARDEDDGVGEWAQLSTIDEAKPSCYSIKEANWPNGGDWGTHFYFGGPGGCF